MTLNQLKYFCTACRTRSITKASEELFVTQPTISINYVNEKLTGFTEGCDYIIKIDLVTLTCLHPFA